MVDMDKIVSLCKRRGFIFQSSEIYGGTGSCWDYDSAEEPVNIICHSRSQTLRIAR